MLTEINGLNKNSRVYIIPCGFRCYTRPDLRKENLTGKSGPFDNGFFPPNMIASVLKDKDFEYNAKSVKYATLKLNRPIIEFQTKSREWIDDQIKSKIADDNFLTSSGEQVIDGHGGYFTYTTRHNFIICHYVTYNGDIKQQIASAQNMLSRRISRILEICKDKTITPLFVYRDKNGFNEYIIDNNIVDISPESIEFQKLSDEIINLNSKSKLICFHQLAKGSIHKGNLSVYNNSQWGKFTKILSNSTTIIL